MNYLLFILIVFTFFSLGFAQDKSEEISPICEQPFSSKFDEFEFTTLEEAMEHLDLYGLQIKNLNATGIVIGYGGKITESNQGRSIAYKIEEYLTDKFKFYKYVTISTWEGGHREKPTVELFIKPQRCSENPEPMPTLNFDEVSYDEVSYKEESSFFAKDIFRRSTDDLENLLINKTEPIYPPAAKAVRARGKVLVLVTVDEKGKVVKATAIDGHPLLRVASETAIRNWKYRTVIENNKPVKFGGKVVIDWDIIADKWYSEYYLSNN